MAKINYGQQNNAKQQLIKEYLSNMNKFYKEYI